jgi:pyruvate/2-oxoglutarate dehydrogenase complex dihydrolipoamide dehydrogenase (E3) component
MAKRIGVYMQQGGTRFLMQKVPVGGEKLENGKVSISFKNADGSGEIESETFDTVLVATGRYPDTKALNCEGNPSYFPNFNPISTKFFTNL